MQTYKVDGESMLLDLTEIARRLDGLVLPDRLEVSGFRLGMSTLSLVELEHAESILGQQFADSFRSILLEFDFGNFTIGPIIFSGSGDYLGDLLELNIRDDNTLIPKWWGDGARPQDNYLIATSDSYGILLDNNSGAILAFEFDGLGCGKYPLPEILNDSYAELVR